MFSPDQTSAPQDRPVTARDDVSRDALVAFAVVCALTAWRALALFAGSLDLSFDEAQYWGWAQDPAFGYFSKPPVVAWVIWLTTAIGGDAEPWVRLGAPLAHGGTALALFLVGRALFSPRVGLWSAVVYATLPAVSISALFISTDPFLLLFWALALHAVVRALSGFGPGFGNGGLRWWALAGLWIGLGLLSKYAMVFFMGSLVLFLAWSAEDRRELRRPGVWLALGLGGLVYLPNLVWNHINGFASYRHTGENVNLKSELFNPGELAEFLASQLGVFGPLLFVALLVLLLGRAVPATRDRRLRLLIAFTVPVLAAISAQALLSRANANWAASAYVAATPLVVAWLWQRRRWRWVLHASVALHVLAAGVLYNFDTAARLAGVELSRKTDPFKDMRGWDAMGAEVRALAAAHPDLTLLFDDRKMMASLLYYARPVVFDAVMFRSAPGIQNHYEMTTTMAGRDGDDFLLVARHGASFAGRFFEAVESLGTVRVAVHDDFAHEALVYRMTGYKGHPTP